MIEQLLPTDFVRCGGGQGPACCALLGADNTGMVCLLGTEAEQAMRNRVAADQMGSKFLPTAPYPACQDERLRLHPLPIDNRKETPEPMENESDLVPCGSFFGEEQCTLTCGHSGDHIAIPEQGDDAGPATRWSDDDAVRQARAEAEHQAAIGDPDPEPSVGVSDDPVLQAITDLLDVLVSAVEKETKDTVYSTLNDREKSIACILKITMENVDRDPLRGHLTIRGIQSALRGLGVEKEEYGRAADVVIEQIRSRPAQHVHVIRL